MQCHVRWYIQRGRGRVVQQWPVRQSTHGPWRHVGLQPTQPAVAASDDLTVSCTISGLANDLCCDVRTTFSAARRYAAIGIHISLLSEYRQVHCTVRQPSLLFSRFPR